MKDVSPTEESWRTRLPSEFTDLVDGWLQASPVPVRLSRTRRTKHGDFRSARPGRPALVTVNQDLHPVEFLITLTHEIAHFRNWQKFGRRVSPHGPEWRAEFRGMLLEVLQTGMLGPEISAAVVRHYFKRQRIGSGTSQELNRLLGKPGVTEGAVYVQHLPEGASFTLRSGRTFIKGRKMRKRYQCRDVASSRIYSVHPMAEVKETIVP